MVEDGVRMKRTHVLDKELLQHHQLSVISKPELNTSICLNMEGESPGVKGQGGILSAAAQDPGCRLPTEKADVTSLAHVTGLTGIDQPAEAELCKCKKCDDVNQLGHQHWSQTPWV